MLFLLGLFLVRINTYLQPLVHELMELWSGVLMKTASGMQVFVRAALLCTSCDIPATRKVSGFVDQNAYRACSRCLKSFPTERFGEKADFAGTDCTNWESRSLQTHRDAALKHRQAKTKAEQKVIEREHGCRHSVLLELPYFDVIRFSVVDPMHNLLLGTAKHVLSVWISNGLLEASQFESIQKIVDSFVTPSDIGRLPSKISSGFSGFTAEQWQNWTLIYSLCSLKGTIPHKDYDCWLLFVKAIGLLCQRHITLEALDKGDALLMEFCESFEKLYGKDRYTINIHLHGHLKECILDFGPVYSFWLFSFERLNGVLGSYHTNCPDISVQIMRRYTSSQQFGVHNWPEEYKNDYFPLLSEHTYQKGSLRADCFEQALQSHNQGSSKLDVLPRVVEVAWEDSEKKLLGPLVISIMEHEQCTLLAQYQRAPAVIVGGFLLGSSSSRHVTKSHVMAIHPEHPSEAHLAKIEHFCTLIIRDNSNNPPVTVAYWVACVSFYDSHDCKVWFSGPMQVWCRSISPGNYYIKLSDIKSRVAYCEHEVDFGRVIGKQKVLVVSVLSNFGR